jgi:outer membrane protein assembly factor BamB
MGFLMRNAAAIPVLLVALLSGCSGLRLDAVPHPRPGDWTMFAGTSARANVSPVTISPPLSEEWEYDVSAGIGNCSPIVIDTFLFVTNLRGDLYALHLRTGKKIGYVTLGDAIPGSPIIEGNIAIIGASNSRESLVAFDLLTGRSQWKKSYGDIEVTPLLLGQRLYFGNTEGIFYCVDPREGEKIWEFKIQDNPQLKGFRSSPASDGTTIVFGCDNGWVYGLSVQNGEERWKFRAGYVVAAAPAIASGIAFVGDLHGGFHAINMNDGSSRWDAVAGAAIYANATVDSDRVIVGTTGGNLIAYSINDGHRIWAAAIGSPINAGATGAGAFLYVGTLNHELFAVRGADGAIVWKGDAGGRIKTSPAVSDGHVFVATDEHTILSYRGIAQ